MGRILALDFGTVRIGVAISDPLQITAQPLAVWPVDAWPERLRDLLDDYEVDKIIVGLPTSLNGGEGPSAQGARNLAAEVAALTGLAVELVDERFSSRIAEQALLSGDVRRSRRRESLDKVAAAVILQGYLDRR
jgi:putative Holliday junction resolvase